MTKKRAIVSYEKLSIEQRKQLLLDFPDGFTSGMTQIKTPTGETLDALLWDTEEITYLVKIPKSNMKTKSLDDDDDEDDDDDVEDLPKNVVKDDVDDFDDSEDDDSYDDDDDDDDSKDDEED